jgi:hypothetical protein
VLRKRLAPITLALLTTACVATPPESGSTSTSAPETTSTTTNHAGATVNSTAAETCEGTSITFDHPPVDLDAIEYVVPLGLMTGSHVTPVDHQYFQNSSEPDLLIDVYSPAAGRVAQIQHMTQIVSDDEGDPIDDYRLIIQHTCTITTIFIHVDELSPGIASVAPPPGGYAAVNVPVEAGEVIGAFTANVDFSVVDLDVTLGGLLVPEHYEVEPWKIHTPDPFPYFAEEIEQAMIAKSLRTAEPIGGQFAYDIDGRLVGNWFQEGTNGYAGADPERYWAGHLAIAYDHLDPSHIVVSIGTFNGASAQFGVRGNGPDPADVSIDSGVVAYELVDYDYWADGDRWDRTSLVQGIEARNNDDTVRGVVLFELISGRLLRVEVFPGSSPAEVNGFTGGALIYER